jgi:hypothetical protein
MTGSSDLKFSKNDSGEQQAAPTQANGVTVQQGPISNVPELPRDFPQ